MIAPTAALQLRPVQPADREFLYRVYSSTRQEELALTDWGPEQQEAFLRMQFEAQDRYYHENYTGARFEVIEARSRPVGRLYQVTWEREIRIIDIALLPEFRGQGLGTALLRELLAEGRRRGLAVSIHVERMNPALRWYERLGFRLVEDKGVYLLLEWTPEGSQA